MSDRVSIRSVVLSASLAAVGCGSSSSGAHSDASSDGTMPGDSGPPACTSMVTSLAAVQSAVAGAAPGDVICLADGTYGELTLDETKAAPGVMVRAEHPGAATLAGATLQGSYLTISRFRMVGTFDARPGSTGMTADHNLFVGGAYFGVMACASTEVTCNDVSIIGNQFVGRFDEDAIRGNVYHDGSDADSIGLLIEGNEFSGNVEYGGHNDVLQTVWVGDHLVFRRNYLHDFGGQGFFVKDQATAIDSVVFEDNLIVRQNLGCDPDSNCAGFQLAPFQMFGPLDNVSIKHNTVWPDDPQGARPEGGIFAMRGDGWGTTALTDNVIDQGYSDSTSPFGSGYSASSNTACDLGGIAQQGFTSDCAPAFANVAGGDYRLTNGRGVTWAIPDQHFGP